MSLLQYIEIWLYPFIENKKIYYDTIKVPKNLRFCTLIPVFKLSTENSISVLSKTIDHKDCVFNVSISTFSFSFYE